MIQIFFTNTKTANQILIFSLFRVHGVKSVQIWSYFWSVFSCTSKYGPEITPHLDTFHAVVTFVIVMNRLQSWTKCSEQCKECKQNWMALEFFDTEQKMKFSVSNFIQQM